MSSGTDPRPSRGPRDPPWQFLGRAIAVVSGLALLVIVEAQGVAFYFAWGLIGLALVSEAAATLLFWRRSRRGG